MATNIASYVGEEQVWTYVKGLRPVAGDARRARGDEEAGRAGDGGGRDGALDRAAAAAVEPGDDRKPDRAGEGREAVRRHLLVAHPRRRRRRLPGHGRGDSGRQGREDPGRHHPHEDRAQEAVGTRERNHRDGAEGARRGPQHPGERVSVHRRPEQSVVDRSAVGARRRARRRCSSGCAIRARGAHAAGDPERAAELVQPLPRDRRRLGRHAARLAAARAEQAVPGQADERADRSARRQSGRRAVRRADRGGRQRADRVLPSFRAGHAAGDEAAVDVDRLGRGRA